MQPMPEPILSLTRTTQVLVFNPSNPFMGNRPFVVYLLNCPESDVVGKGMADLLQDGWRIISGDVQMMPAPGGVRPVGGTAVVALPFFTLTREMPAAVA